MNYANQTLHSDDYRDPESLEIDEKVARSIRHAFIRKVYGIICAQILLTTLIGGYLTLNEAARLWIISSGQWVVYMSSIAGLVTLCGMACIPGATRRHPTNMILLFGFTVCMAIGVGSACAVVAAVHGLSVVLQALMATTVLVVGLTFYSFQTKRDFTSLVGVLYMVLWGLMGFGLLRLLFPRSQWLETIYAIVGALVFSVYIIVDTQMLIGGKRLEVSEDDYVMIALMLYMDIINLFLNLLQLLSSQDDN